MIALSQRLLGMIDILNLLQEASDIKRSAICIPESSAEQLFPQMTARCEGALKDLKGVFSIAREANNFGDVVGLLLIANAKIANLHTSFAACITYPQIARDVANLYVSKDRQISELYGAIAGLIRNNDMVKESNDLSPYEARPSELLARFGLADSGYAATLVLCQIASLLVWHEMSRLLADTHLAEKHGQFGRE